MATLVPLTSARARRSALFGVVLLALAVVAAAQAQGPLLQAASQTSRDFSLAVGRVVLPAAGFVVAYPAHDDGSPVLNRPLGSVYLEAGDHQDVSVPLSRGRVEHYGYAGTSQPLVLMLVRDDGDGKLAGKGGPDTPFLRGAAPYLVTIGFREGDSLRANDQTLADGALTVQEVYAAQPRFVAVHAVDDGGRIVAGPPLGVVAVDAGRQRYVHVPLDAAALARAGYGAEPRPVAVVLHADSGGGAFDASRDAPVPGDAGPLAQQVALALPSADPPSIALDGPVALQLGPDGISVQLTNVSNPQPAFVVLRRLDAAGQVVDEPILGRTGRLTPRTRKQVTIRLRDDYVPLPGDELVAMMHADDGDRAFRYPASDPPLQVDGAPFEVRFTVR